MTLKLMGDFRWVLKKEEEIFQKRLLCVPKRCLCSSSVFLVLKTLIARKNDSFANSKNPLGLPRAPGCWLQLPLLLLPPLSHQSASLNENTVAYFCLDPV